MGCKRRMMGMHHNQTKNNMQHGKIQRFVKSQDFILDRHERHTHPLMIP